VSGCADLVVTYQGSGPRSGWMDARDLAESILGTAELWERTGSQLYGEGYRARLMIGPIRHEGGAFELRFQHREEVCGD